MEKKSFWDNIPDIIKVLWLYVASIISVGAMYFLLTGIDQGIDVVIQAGEQKWSGILCVVTVSLWAYLVWYSCRLLSYTKQSKETNISTEMLQLLPRLLAYNCFICVQVSILSLPTFFSFTFWNILAFIVVFNLYYYILHQWFEHRKKYAAIIGWSFILFVVCAYAHLAYNHINSRGGNDDMRHEFWLPVLGIAVFIAQIVMVYYFFRRRHAIDARVDAAAQAQQSGAAIRIAKYINGKFAGAEKKDIRYFLITSVIALIIYCVAIFNIRVADQMGPMAFVMLALGVLVGFSNLVSFFSIRLRVNLFFFIFILAIIVGKFYNPYELRTMPVSTTNFHKNKPSVKRYLYNWVKKRQPAWSKGDAGHRYPVYVVCSDGGASRAGNWVCSVLSSLQDSSANDSMHDIFSDHILAISGASGGSVGNATFYGMLRARKEGLLTGPFSMHCDTFFNGDFLTYTLARLFGPDMLRHIIPFRLPDRGAALETVLAEGTKDTVINTQLARPLSQVLDTTGDLPILYITTTRVQDGMPCIISSAQLPENTQRKDVTRLLDSNEDFRLSTSAILSSRFPYVSPAGGIKNNYFVDGGYVDNAGSGIMLDFIQRVDELVNDSTDKDTWPLFHDFMNRVSFHVIHIYNSPDDTTKFGRINPLTNDLVTPVLTLAGMQGSSTLIYTESLKQYFLSFTHDSENSMIEYSLYNDTAKSEASYPMSWVISCYQLHRMNDRLYHANIEHAGQFWFLRKKG